MKILLAGDYHQELRRPAPVGLVADPPDYRTCIAVASRFAKGHASPGTATLCRQLYQAVKLQAVGFLVSVQWIEQEEKEHRESATAAEVNRALVQLRKREFPTPGAFQKYLRENQRTVADEIYLLKRNVLSQKMVKRLEREGLKFGDKSRVAKLAQEFSAKWTARTSCRPGYVTEPCKEHRASEPSPPSPNSLLLKITGQPG